MRMDKESFLRSIKSLKDLLAQEAKTEEFNLSRFDRFVLRNFFGFDDDFQLFKQRKMKAKEDASNFVQQTLWSSMDEKGADESVATEFSGCGDPVARLFADEKNATKTANDMFSFFEEEWFSHGYNLSDEQQIAIIRIFQSFDRVYEPDLCFNRFAVSTKLFMVGHVRINAKWNLTYRLVQPQTVYRFSYKYDM